MYFFKYKHRYCVLKRSVFLNVEDGMYVLIGSFKYYIKSVSETLSI